MRNEKGAVSTLVLFTVLFFVAVLTGSYITVTSLQSAQLKSDVRIQEIYRQDVNNIDEVYNELLARYTDYNKPYIPEGFEHTGGTWNSGYTITETATGNEFVWVPCVTEQSQVREGDKVVTFGRILPTVKEDGTLDTTDPYYMYNKSNYTITGEIAPSKDIRTSVEKYGGFYIAAYEAGIEGTTENYKLETRTVTDGSVKPLSQPEKGLWNYISRTDAIKVAESMVNTIDGVKSGLISGEAWDTTLQWMVNTSENSANEPNLGYDIDSTGKGWYSDIASNTKHLTGYYAVNNIYDMAGNLYEWTTENCTKNGESLLVYRGGRYYYSGSVFPAASRGNEPDNASSTITFRVVLYK